MRECAEARDPASAGNEEVLAAPTPGRAQQKLQAWRYWRPHPQAEGLRPSAESPLVEQPPTRERYCRAPSPGRKRGLVEAELDGEGTTHQENSAPIGAEHQSAAGGMACWWPELTTDQPGSREMACWRAELTPPTSKGERREAAKPQSGCAAAEKRERRNKPASSTSLKLVGEGIEGPNAEPWPCSKP